jgi:UDP-N-acetylglucosamine 2-epimerase (non-hydrolysing)
VLNAVAERSGLPVIVSTHPRTRKRIEALGLTADANVRFHKPFGFLDYVALQTRARAVLSDSGTITEESSILNFPALNLREVHERPEGFTEASVMFVGLDVQRVLQGLAILEEQPRGDRRLLRLVDDYAPTNVSDKVLRIVQSYTDFVNRRSGTNDLSGRSSVSRWRWRSRRCSSAVRRATPGATTRPRSRGSTRATSRASAALPSCWG